MCGITGWVNSDPKQIQTPEDEAILHQMCDSMIHRGPDSEGIWLGEGASLGMRRLAILDIASGDQPFFNQTRSAVVVMNGEIYNYRELRSELISKGYSFKTDSDTEVIPHLYDEYGERFPEFLNGMFAIAIWDKEKRKLLIARDRFGEKPLFYGLFDGKFIFASEAKVLLSHPSVDPTLNRDALSSYLSFDYVPAPLTIYEGISKLPAANLLIFSNNEIELKEYWKLSFEKNSRISINEAQEELITILSDSVRMRMISDVPLGILLSGGIDSSTIAALAQSQSTERIKTFSIGFEEDSFDESEHARTVASHLGTEHFERILSVEAARDLISEIGTWLDEPFADGSLIPTYLLSKFVKENVTVALGGDGGDELFAGYPMYFAHKVARIYKTIPRFMRRGAIEPIVNRLPTSTNNLSFDYKAKRFVGATMGDQIEQHHSWFGSFSREEVGKLLSFESDFDIYSGARKTLNSSNVENYIEKMQCLDMKYYLAEDILTKVDRATMAVSLEARAPFLDQRIAEFAASIPIEFKLRGRITKYILKESVRDLLPPAIIDRPKKGFGIPMAKWLNGSLNPLLHDLLSESRLRQQGLFNSGYVAELISEHENGIKNNYKQLWTLLVFEQWYENFFSR